ncbi:MAG TPA: hypothetical protein VHW66_04975 [Stellaceae bacterium]|jgi:hypothetical protein|nr:hypothetical protein [Stellaceae bacterium]
MAGAAAIRVQYRCIDGCHVYTSEDVYGLYVANRDAEKAYDAIAPSLEKLIQLNEGLSCRVEPIMTFSEMVRSARNPDQPVAHEITSRSFVARAA